MQGGLSERKESVLPSVSSKCLITKHRSQTRPDRDPCLCSLAQGIFLLMIKSRAKCDLLQRYRHTQRTVDFSRHFHFSFFLSIKNA